MATATKAHIETALSGWIDPYLGQDLVTAGCVRHISINAGRVEIAILLGYPAAAYVQTMQQGLTARLLAIEGIHDVAITIESRIAAHQSKAGIKAIGNVKNIIAVASGKGGVGKSTVAANLALALAAEGAVVGILDADIYGPSQQLMMGIDASVRPDTREQKYFVPIKAHGIQLMSMGVLVTESTPMVWRGPMASGAFQQLLGQTLWENVDYLIVDMPPGTGDIQLTLSQSAPVTGAVIVTTPQDIAVLDARKGIEMFRKVDIPVLGVVENMSLHTCSKCGHTEHIFGQHGGGRIATEYGVAFLGALPLDIRIREQADAGVPIVVADPTGSVALCYREIARHLAAQLSLSNVRRDAIANVVTIHE